MITLDSDILIRISRNNGEDTLQFGAVEQRTSASPMITLGESIIPRGVTCRHVLQAFSEAHKAYPNWEHADCQVFAQNIYRKLDPNRAIAVLGAEIEEEDDFM